MFVYIIPIVIIKQTMFMFNEHKILIFEKKKRNALIFVF